MKQVYFLHAPSVNLLKIGVSGDPERRIGEVQWISPVDVELIGAMDGGHDVEADLHRRFASVRHHGEWFHATPELIEFAQVESLMSAWNRAAPAARERFLTIVDRPVMDRNWGTK